MTDIQILNRFKDLADKLSGMSEAELREGNRLIDIVGDMDPFNHDGKRVIMVEAAKCHGKGSAYLDASNFILAELCEILGITIQEDLKQKNA